MKEARKTAAPQAQISVRKEIDLKKRELLQKEVQRASESIYHQPITTIFDELKILKTQTNKYSFADIYELNLLQLRLCQRSICKIIKQARRGNSSKFAELI